MSNQCILDNLGHMVDMILLLNLNKFPIFDFRYKSNKNKIIL